MKKLVSKVFLGRNSQQGINRYLSKLGFSESVRYEPGPTKKEVWVVDNPVVEPVVVEEKPKAKAKKRIFRKKK